MSQPPVSAREEPSAQRRRLALIFLGGAVAMLAGWRTFRFMTDDAYIAFRYISNAHLGFGYVWNPPPFQPVEGYTSFLWVALLDRVWRLTGIEPPASANWISLGFSLGSLALAGGMALRLRRDRGGATRMATLALALLFSVTNRTVLTWSSSGLETAMDNFFILAWTCFLLFARNDLTRALGGASTAALLALTRPDGLLFSMATLALNLWLALAGPGGRARSRSLAAGFLPFSLVAVHQAWRLRMYGEWLPNTYFAKVIDAWPESGFRYLLSFVLEYAVWFPAVFITWACARFAGGFLAGFLPRLAREPARALRAPETLRAVTRTAVVATLGAHALYYVVVVGGDHFEYRVFSHLPPLVFAGLVWAADRLTPRPARANLILAAALALSLPLPWSHWWLTRNLDTRRQTFTLRMPVAPHWPRLFRPYAALFDDTQDWLIQRLVCCRHQEHKIFCLDQLNHYPPRAEGMKLSGADLPVLAEWCVGVPAWMLPHVIIIDRLGLNDHVIARTPPPLELNRRMAHGRMSPAGYVESFRPNVVVEEHRAVVQPRAAPLTAGEIQDLEKSWRAGLPGAAH